MVTPVIPTAGQNLFTPVTYHEFRKLGHRNTHQFPRERERYLLKIDDGNKSGTNVTVTTLTPSSHNDLLLSLITINEFPDLTLSNQVIEEGIHKWINHTTTKCSSR